MTATPQRELDSRLDTLDRNVKQGEVDSADAEAIQTFIAAYDPDNLLETPPAGESTLKTGSCNLYVSRLTEAARRITLTDASAGDVNGVLQSLLDDGRSKWTVDSYSTAFRKFYSYHDGGPASEDITKVDTPNGATFDPDDMLMRDEIHELLDAADNARDRAVFALLIFTGIRNNALRTLRVQDVDPQEGVWKVNDDQTDGLKGIEKYGTTRPLLGARGPVRDWLSYHPASDDSDAYLITGRPRYGRADPSNPVAGSTIRRVMDRLVDTVDNPAIERKPTHPHMMRHNFVTICKRDYNLPDETVKFLIGHSPSSKVMETTYAHLSDQDHIERAEVAAGIRDPEKDDSPLTPGACTVCGEPLPETAKACPACGTVFTPDAQTAEEQMDADVKQDYAQTDPADTATQEKVETVDKLLSDPEVKQALLEKINK